MAIPGQRPAEEIRGKVRIGVVKTSQSTGRTYPAAVDYFVSDDAVFQRLYPGQPKTIRIVPAFDTAEEFFSTGMEWWTKQKDGKNFLACYTKDSGDNPVALRSRMYLDKDAKGETLNHIVGVESSSGRFPIKCPFRDCSHFKKHGNKAPDCRPMGRLTFNLAGEPMGMPPLQIDTKSWNTIEEIEKVLKRAEDYAGALTGLVFDLSVEFKSQGDKKFPVLSIMEVEMEVNTQEDIAEADAILSLAVAVENNEYRKGLAAYLDARRPGWRDDQAVIARIKEIGVQQAISNILDRARA